MAKRGPYRKKPLADRFEAKVDRSGGPEACHPWTGALNNCGYGQVGVGGNKSALSHRVAWELSRGSIPSGLCVLHSCDNPWCVNVRHLSLGSRSENLRDMYSRKRSGNKGRRVNDQVIKVVKFMQQRRKPGVLAALHGVSETTVRRWFLKTS